ncbi:TetR/AcrR family transcriptional regulator [Catenuloplanes atrovinosus]|uniref:TetR/AcrR family acrAB operon transcriptional repressor n=1 Tax=Catenuloplanes atrovinosus TaxID=137266 RepID=A0AAE3YW17_9ACTN|nr:TetR/AcrR family transcriptional regulator [Catenuloplanes atrovinosus]MDR7279595.1 TetR/AcrR family acrAB operon transcriptional repressor [Catenuloplanes atrovinosus]
MSSQGRRRIDEIGDESRRRILDAAEELFAERGLDRTSFVDIAERSGISRGSIPWHFKNKNGLVMAVVERAVERLMSAERYQTVPPLTELFEDSAALLSTGNSALMFTILPEAIRGTGAVREQYRQFLGRRRDGLADWLRARRPAGVDPETAARRERVFAAALNGAMVGIHLQALIDPESFDLGESLQSIATLIDKNLADLWV